MTWTVYSAGHEGSWEEPWGSGLELSEIFGEKCKFSNAKIFHKFVLASQTASIQSKTKLSLRKLT